MPPADSQSGNRAMVHIGDWIRRVRNRGTVAGGILDAGTFLLTVFLAEGSVRWAVGLQAALARPLLGEVAWPIARFVVPMLAHRWGFAHPHHGRLLPPAERAGLTLAHGL